MLRGPARPNGCSLDVSPNGTDVRLRNRDALRGIVLTQRPIRASSGTEQHAEGTQNAGVKPVSA